jgi:hypothetical protein
MTRTLLLVAALGAVLAPALASEKHKAAAPMSDKAIIASAMRAAPAKVGAGAKIVAFDDKGRHAHRARRHQRIHLHRRQSANARARSDVHGRGRDGMGGRVDVEEGTDRRQVGPDVHAGGGTDASNTDPFATAPTHENHWIKTGPHVMVVGGDAAFYDQYPKSPDPDTSMPYVMWAGTPYQHLMVPTH